MSTKSLCKKPIFCVNCGGSFALAHRKLCADCFEKDLKRKRMDWLAKDNAEKERRRLNNPPKPPDYAASSRAIAEQVRLMEEADPWYKLAPRDWGGNGKEDW